VRVPAALERNAGTLADTAVRAVAADQIARPHLLGAPVPVAKFAGDLLLTGRDGDQLHAALDLDARWARCSFSTPSVSACETKSRNG
jgi:hypothetical protein